MYLSRLPDGQAQRQVCIYVVLHLLLSLLQGRRFRLNCSELPSYSCLLSLCMQQSTV